MTDVVQTRKEQIFDKTLELVAGFGYENVSMRNIGDAVDIKACSIYNHYEKKEHILEDFYDYYTNNFLKRRLSEEEVRRVIREGTIEDIAALLPDGGYTQFEPRETTRMMLLTKIIYTRMYFDPKAGEIYHSTTELAKKNTQKKLDYGIEVGRFVPFDTYFCAHTIEVLYESIGVLAFSRRESSENDLVTDAKVSQWMDSVRDIQAKIVQLGYTILKSVEKPLV